jgi:CHAT domain-containing protein/Tfp pilus assembly protein PilF
MANVTSTGAAGIQDRQAATQSPSLDEAERPARRYAEAISSTERALRILEKSLGPDHPKVAPSLNYLADLYRDKGDYAKAEPLYQRALGIREKALGPEHPEVALSLNNLAVLYYAKGDYPKAEPLQQRALGIREKALGPEHPEVANSLNNLAGLFAAKRDITQAIAYQARAVQVSERNIALNLATGSERQKLLYLATLSGETNRTLSLHIESAPDNPAARRLACTTVLQRKGRALDAMMESIATLRRRLDPQDHALLDLLTTTRARLATLMLGGPSTPDTGQHRATIQSLEKQVEQLEADISRRSAAFRVESQPVTIETIQAAIPSEAALVEFVRFHAVDFQQNKRLSPRYAAYVLRHQGEPAWIKLGEAQDIEPTVHTLREALRDPNRQDVKKLARALDAKLMEPVRKLVGEQRLVLLSPDGVLHLVPFAALVDAQERYLAEQYRFIYLTTGRDLLRLQVKSQPAQGPVVIANPDFGTTSVAQGDQGSSTRQSPANLTTAARDTVDVSQLSFGPLPGTAEEARVLQTILPSAAVLTQASATKSAVKQRTAPSIVHIATHGFFLPDLILPLAPVADRGLFISEVRPEDLMALGVHVENPLLRSGLALAGANVRRSGEDDGILTALEASGLNLWGTKLVVLSACDTGVGEVKNGEGVYGLRRALVLAGAETQMMSLWPVSDEGTRDLMIGYYKALQAGQGRGEALRQVQLQMLASPDQRHPFYWASFIQSGEWANLDGKR